LLDSQLPLKLLGFLLLVAFLVFLFVVAGDLHRRYLIRRWMKAFTGANQARLDRKFAEAHRLLKQCLAYSAQLPRHWAVRAVTYDELAALFDAEGNYAQAEKLRRSVLNLREKFDGPRAPETAIAASNLATALDDAGKSVQAEPLHRQAADYLQEFPAYAGQAASVLNNYARCLQNLGRLAEADELYRRSMQLAEKAGTNNPPSTGNSLNNLATLLNETARYTEAESLHRQVLAKRIEQGGPQSLPVSTSLINLASVKLRQGEYAEAEQLFGKAKTIREQELPVDHPDRLSSLNNEAVMLSDRKSTRLNSSHRL